MSPITEVNKPDLIKLKKRLGRPVTTGRVRKSLSFTANNEEEEMLDDLSIHFAGDSVPNRSVAVTKGIRALHKIIFKGKYENV